MAWWWFHRQGRDSRSRRCRFLERRAQVLGAAIVWTVVWWAPVSVGAEPLPQRDVNEIVRLGESRGLSQDDVAKMLLQASRAADRGLPPETILNKIKEGLAKGVPPSRIDPVLQDMTGKLETAKQVLGEIGGKGKGGDRRAMEVTAEALGRGVKPEEIRALGRSGRGKKGGLTAESLAFGAKGLALTKEAGIPGDQGVPLISEAIRQGFKPSDLLKLGREVKKHGRELRENKVLLKDVQKALERGERVDRLFRREDRDRSGRGGGRDDRGESEERRESRERVRDEDRGRSGSGREDRIERRDRLERHDREVRSGREGREDRSGGSSGSGRGRGGRDH